MQARSPFLVLPLVLLLVSCSQDPRPTSAETDAPSKAPEASEHSEAGEEHEEGGTQEITLSEEAMVGIALVKAERRRIVRELSFAGEIAFHPDRVAIIGPKMSGRIESILAGVGDKVTRGQVLATLDSADFARARGEYVSASARRDAAQAAFDRRERLRAGGIDSVRDVEEARAELLTSRAELDAALGTLRALGIDVPAPGAPTSSVITLTSPLAGTVVKREAVLGQTVEATAALLTVADLTEVWVLLDVYESDLGRVAIGAEATMTTPAYPGRTFEGRVTHVAEVLDERTRTAKVRVVTSNEDGALRPGMFCRATLRAEAPAAGAVQEGEEEAGEQDQAGHEALAVPSEAIQRVEDGTVVFVHVGERTFRAQRVRVGEDTGRDVEIKSGLRAGDEVAGEGSLSLKAELERESIGEEDED